MQWIALALVTGNVIITLFHGPPDRQDPVLLLLVAMLALLIAWRVQSRLALLLGVILLGAAQALGSAWSFHQRLDTLALPLRDVAITVRVLDMPRCFPEACQYRGEVLAAADEDMIGSVLAIWHDRRTIQPTPPQPLPRLDEHWRMTVSIRAVVGRSNPAGQDREQLMYRQHVIARASVSDPDQAKPVQRARSIAASLRNRVVDWIDRQTHQTEIAALLKALSAGDTRGVTPTQWQAFRETGSLHLMAISGLHIGLIAALGWWLARGLYRIRWLRQRCSRAALAVGPALILASLYAMLAGMSLPTRRALIMLGIVAAATLCMRRQNGWQALGVAALLMLLLDPRQTLSPGFWFSFSAVAVLIASAQCHPHWRHSRHSWWLIQWVVMCGLLPVSLGFGQPINPVSPLLNLLLIPYLGLVLLPLLLLGLSLGLSLDLLTGSDQAYHTTGGLLLQPAQWAAQGLSGFLDWCAAHLYWPVFLTTHPQLLLLSVVLVLLLLGPGFRGWLITGLMGVGMLVVLDRPGPQDQLRLHVLDVGQGLSVIIEYPGGYGIYDTGPGHPGRPGSSEQVIEPMLAQLFGAGDPDFLLLSHHDNDHAGGYPRLSQVRPAARELLSGTRTVTGNCRQGIAWVQGETRFKLLHPGSGLPYLGNDSSCVLLVRYGTQSILLPGDIGEVIETRLIRDYRDELENLSVLIASHHGSNSSSSEAFLAHLEPELSVISSGRDNRFGLPHPAVVDRLRRHNSRVLDTASCGYLEIALDKTGVRVLRRHRQDRPRLWHRRAAGETICDSDA